MKLNNQLKHELGMIDDLDADDSTFERMADEFSNGRKTKYSGGRKYSERHKSIYRARKLAVKAREERRAKENQAMKMLNHQLQYNKYNKINEL